MTQRRGFAFIEAAVLVIVVVCVAALVLLLGGEQRRQGRLGEDIGKLRQIGALTVQYTVDNADKFWTFSWRKGQALSQYPDLNNAPDDLTAGANQAVDILRRRAGRTDIAPITAWMPYISYSHLPLLDAVGRIPDELFISAGDANRLKWSRDPLGFDAGVYQPAPSSAEGGRRWPYSASFQLPVCFYDRSPVSARMYQSATHNGHAVPSGGVLGGQTISAAAFPAHKVLLHDQNARHFGPQMPYCTHDQARLPLLFVDGAVLVKAAAESNRGWLPSIPSSSVYSTFIYQPAAWDPPAFSGGATDNVTGRFRWTRGSTTEHGHVGRDFGGPETCSGQPGCP